MTKIAVDLGGTNMRVALMKGNKIFKYTKKQTPNNKNAILKLLIKSILEIDNKSVKGIGVAFGGPVERGVVRNVPNISLNNFNLRKYLQDKFKKRVVIENDANCVALAEAKLGCKKKNFIILTLGTGIGGGIIIEGRLYKGQGYAGELGHIILHNDKDFEELVASKRQRNLTKQYFGKSLMIQELIKLNNHKSKKILDEIAKYLGQGIGSLIDVFDPEVVILAGGIKDSGNKFLSMIKKQAQKYVFIPRKTEIKWTKLKYPGVLGAGLLIN